MQEKKSFLEDLGSDKPESFQEETFVPAKRKVGHLAAAAVSALFVCFLILLFLQLGKTAVPDMTDWQLEEVQTWVLKEHENTVLDGVYTKETRKDKVISQDIKKGRKISKGTVLTVKYSLGADPEEAVKVPDLKGMKLSEIKTWITENQMAGVTIKNETSDVIPKDEVINYELIDGSNDLFLRKNRMVIYVSSGNEELNETVKMPDFYGKSKAEVLQWQKDNQMKVKVQELFNSDIEYGKIFYQNIKKDTKITRKDVVEVSISRGKAIKTPDFNGMSRNEASELAALYGMSVFFKLKVSTDTVDTVIDQNIPAGRKIDQKQILTLQIAKEDGKIIVPDFKGLTKEEAVSLAGLYGMKVFLENSDETGDQGIITTQSVAAGIKINEKQVVTLILKENDEQVITPDFKGMSKSEAEVLAKNAEIILSYRETESAKVANQSVISQDIKPKAGVKKGDEILLTIAVNSGIPAKDMRLLSLNDAKAWAMQKGITLNVIDCYSSDYAAGKLYRQDCKAGDFISSNKVLTVYRSLGLVMAENFIGKTKSDIIKWKDEVNQKGAGIKLKFISDTNTNKAKGTVTNQSILEELVGLNQEIQVWVSQTDNGILIKNFEGLASEDMKLWCDTNSVPYIINECYSDTYDEGKLYGQNYSDTYLPKGEYLKINLSLGKLFVTDFTGKSKSEVLDWMKEVNKKKANIKIDFISGYSSEIGKGKIMYQSVSDQAVDLNSKIVVMVSVGTGN